MCFYHQEQPMNFVKTFVCAVFCIFVLLPFALIGLLVRYVRGAVHE